MYLTNPYFLFGLFAIGIPVVIHLFNFRKYRRVLFSDTRFLEELKLETRKQSRLKHLIILLLRIFAVASLVLAFSQPVIPLDGNKLRPSSSTLVSIWIDNSFSMEAGSEKGRLLDAAREKAAEIAATYRPSDFFQLLTNDFEGRHQRALPRDEFLRMLEELELSPTNRKLSEVERRQLEMAVSRQSPATHFYWRSDFQKNISDFEDIRKDTSSVIFLLPLRAAVSDNLYIDSCWFGSPVHQNGSNVKLFVRIRNTGSEAVEKVPLKMTVNNIQRAVSSISVGAGSEVVTTLTWQESGPGFQQATLEITDNPVVFDDRFYFSYIVSPSVRILCLNGSASNPYLKALFAKDSAFTFNEMPAASADYSSFGAYSFIVLNEISSPSEGMSREISAAITRGCHVLIIPAARMDASSWQSFFSGIAASGYGSYSDSRQRLSLINLNHPVYTGVFDQLPQNIDLPSVNGYYPISKRSKSAMEFLLKMQNGDIFLSAEPSGRGRLYLLATPLRTEHTNFPRHAIFVPTLFQMALLSQPSTALFYTCGNDETLTIPTESDGSEDPVIKIKRSDDGSEFIPQQSPSGSLTKLSFSGQIKTAGHYMLKLGEKQLMPLSFNYDRSESELQYLDAGAIKNAADAAPQGRIMVLDHPEKNTGDMIRDITSGKALWKYFIILALIFLGSEVILLRFWK